VEFGRRATESCGLGSAVVRGQRRMGRSAVLQICRAKMKGSEPMQVSARAWIDLQCGGAMRRTSDHVSVRAAAASQGKEVLAAVGLLQHLVDVRRRVGMNEGRAQGVDEPLHDREKERKKPVTGVRPPEKQKQHSNAGVVRGALGPAPCVRRCGRLGPTGTGPGQG
jgi:hypothetical protein